MAQADYVVANGTGAAVRSSLNGQLAAIVSNNSGATEPATMYAYQWWADTTAGLLKQRNAANNAWITIGTLASANLGLLPLAGGTMTGVLAVTAGTAALPGIAVSGDLNTGITSPGADQLAISTGGTGRLFVDASGLVGIGTGSPRSLFNLAASATSGTILTVENTSTSLVASQYIGRIQFYGNDASAGSSGVRASIDAAVADAGGGTDIVFSNSKFLDSTLYERLRIDQEGNVAVGASATRSYYIDGAATTPRVDVSGANALPLALYRSSYTPYLVIARGDTPGASQAIGGVSFNGYDGADLRESARVSCLRDGTWSSGATPGALVFYTAASSSSSPSERARINSDGKLLAGTSSAFGTASNNSFYSLIQIKGNSNSSTGDGRLTIGTGAATASVTSSTELGRIVFTDGSGADYAYVQGFADGTAGTGDYPSRIVFATTADGAGSPTEQMRIDNAGNLKFNSGYGSAATAYGCRAWVNFNGTGTVAIRASGNVSSITDNGTGDYTVNFTTAMPDANYSAVASGGGDFVDVRLAYLNASYSTTAHRFSITNNSTAVDATFVNVAIFR
jgi:hypothetical protein